MSRDRDQDSSAASSTSFGIGASKEVVRVSSHTHRSRDIDGSIANRSGSINNSIGSINSSNDTQWIAIICEQDTYSIIGQGRNIHQSSTDNSEVDVCGSPLIDSGSISSIVYQMNSIIHKPYNIVSHQSRLVKEGVHVNTDLLGLVGGSSQQSYATMVDDSDSIGSSQEWSSCYYQQLYVGFYIRIVVNSVWRSRSSYNKDIIADVFRRSLNGKGYVLDMTEWSKVKSSSSIGLVDSNVGVLFESEGAVVVSVVPTPIRLPSRMIVIDVCLEREYGLEREHRHIYVLDEMSCALELKSRCLILKMALKMILKMILKICHVPEGVCIPFRSWNMCTRQVGSIIFPSPLPSPFHPRRPPLSFQYCLDLVFTSALANHPNGISYNSRGRSVGAYHAIEEGYSMAEIGNIDILLSMLEIVVIKISVTDIEYAEGYSMMDIEDIEEKYSMVDRLANDMLLNSVACMVSNKPENFLRQH